jgi:hypothetical protein
MLRESAILVSVGFVTRSRTVPFNYTTEPKLGTMLKVTWRGKSGDVRPPEHCRLVARRRNCSSLGSPAVNRNRISSLARCKQIDGEWNNDRFIFSTAT